MRNKQQGKSESQKVEDVVMKCTNDFPMLRLLSDCEIAAVSGSGDGDNLSDVVVTGVRLQNYTDLSFTGGSFYVSLGASGYQSPVSFFDRFFGADSDVIVMDIPAPTDVNGDIVVEATPEQVAAAKLAYAQAGVELSTFQVLGVIASTLFKNRGVGAAVAGGMEIVDINRDALQNAYADMLYYEDGLDGVYDGVSPGRGPGGVFENPGYL
jgi:hypothetical protein